MGPGDPPELPTWSFTGKKKRKKVAGNLGRQRQAGKTVALWPKKEKKKGVAWSCWRKKVGGAENCSPGNI